MIVTANARLNSQIAIRTHLRSRTLSTKRLVIIIPLNSIGYPEMKLHSKPKFLSASGLLHVIEGNLFRLRRNNFYHGTNGGLATSFNSFLNSLQNYYGLFTGPSTSVVSQSNQQSLVPGTSKSYSHRPFGMYLPRVNPHFRRRHRFQKLKRRDSPIRALVVNAGTQEVRGADDMD